MEAYFRVEKDVLELQVTVDQTATVKELDRQHQFRDVERGRGKRKGSEVVEYGGEISAICVFDG
jgi:hypothetical protein